MNPTLEKITLIVVTFLGFYSSFYFGFILTGDYHIGALFGIPFALILAVLSILTIFTKNKVKRVSRIFTLGYILTMLIYVLVIMIIKENGGQNATDYLYHYSYGQSYKILLWIAMAGFLISLIIIFQRGKDKEIKS